MTQSSITEVNALGLTCPEPVMMLHAAIRDIQSGQQVRIKATDPSTRRDIGNFCNFLGHSLVDVSEEGDAIVFLIEKG